MNAYQQYERRERWRQRRGTAITVGLAIAAFIALAALVLP